VGSSPSAPTGTGPAGRELPKGVAAPVVIIRSGADLLDIVESAQRSDAAPRVRPENSHCENLGTQPVGGESVKLWIDAIDYRRPV
jgi:hypothetical protein